MNTNSNITDFRLQIRILMERKKVSIAKLSRISDINSGTVYKYLQGLSEMTAANLEKLFNALNSIEEPKL